MTFSKTSILFKAKTIFLVGLVLYGFTNNMKELKQEVRIIGNKNFVHIEEKGGIFTMVNGDGEAFIPLGMNHVGPMHRFAKYNKEFWSNKISGGILKRNRVDFSSEGARTWLGIVAKDHKEYGFNTLAFHHASSLPTTYCNELNLYYYGKLKMSHIHPRRALSMGVKHFPDVFDQEWIDKLDHFIKNYTSKHVNSKYLLGYSYEDLPAYSIHNMKQRITKFKHHPWIMYIVTRQGKTKGKDVWIEVLKSQYDSAKKAGEMYGLAISTWDAFNNVTDYGLPLDEQKGFEDQALMNAKIVTAYHKAHHDAIRKYDPNHLIFGDKISNHKQSPDWVWATVKDYVDVILIQDFDFFTPEHEQKLKRIYEISGKPVINGDHAYGTLRPNMNRVKGVPVPTTEDKGKQYAIYLKGIMNLPFMLGFQVCGYLETWAGTSDATGKSQTGYFDPMGKPIEDALRHAKAANEQALEWHKKAGSVAQEYSTMHKNSSQNSGQKQEKK